MCKIGDIILVKKYLSQGRKVAMHSFVVLEDRNGQIRGVPFDFIGLVMSSFKDEEQKTRKLSYPGNFPIVADDTVIEDGNENSGYIKAEQFYYFRKDKIDYKVIGYLQEDIFNLLMDFIQELIDSGVEFEAITDNLKE